MPFAFVLHNFEEVWAIRTPQFIIAVSLFTLLGFAVVFLRGWQGWKYVVTAFAGMLFLNVFFPHILSAIWYGRYMPGLISAVGLILPLTVVIIWKIHKAAWFLPRRFLLIILLGGLAGILLVAAFQGVGHLLSRG